MLDRRRGGCLNSALTRDSVSKSSLPLQLLSADSVTEHKLPTTEVSGVDHAAVRFINGNEDRHSF